MIGAYRKAPSDKVVGLAGADERGSDSDRLQLIVRFRVIDLGDVVLGHAPFQHMDGLEVDIGNRFEILRRGVASIFEIRRKRLALHAPNVIQGGLNVQLAESPSASCPTHSS